MKILSVSTATSNLSVALNNDQEIIVEKNEEDKRNHSEHLDPMINEILKENNLNLKDIDRFAVAIGPGSYTGLRIGITTIKMFASILNKSVVGISTLEAMAKAINDDSKLIVSTIDARNDNYFAGGYVLKNNQLENIIPDGHYHIDKLLIQIEEAIKNNDLSGVVFVGQGIEKQADVIEKANIKFEFAEGDQNKVHAGLIGQLAVNAEEVDPDALLPRYLRRTQAEVDWHKKTGKEFEPESNYVEEV
ncbi:tRNA (adenosine(37)-N6)-threonylcarbamoyltransferase complex dimerization subunit type 1 TsaB [Lactobacillus agrestimuris]|uniref:tRNA (adenosine(37)-N6)-threonylcarbamoyltransferase complex dimerization subunit type 1 TsaB n=1 Tax=Lactobacillus agrestimuris TaxID=2941328 RepID=UPI00204382D0|nr:tRNA (adenosine(37)-N6)-threonylcarbamoyltransferase complex dimerization subunit type 1 TsaB [Lactobacillus agrestimuris]